MLLKSFLIFIFLIFREFGKHVLTFCDDCDTFHADQCEIAKVRCMYKRLIRDKYFNNNQNKFVKKCILCVKNNNLMKCF